MFKKVFFTLLMSAGCWCLYAQNLNELRTGASWFGENATHPGFTLNLEYVRRHSTGISTPMRADAGAYFHPRNHNAFMFDVHCGLREHFGRRFALEQYLGLGFMRAFYNGDGLFQVNDKGAVVRVSPSGNPAFMPSVSLGIWIAAGKKTDPERWAVHLRPKAFWQLPVNNLALPHFALQAGITYRIKTLEKRK